MYYIIVALSGAFVAVVVAMLARSEMPFLAGLAPLFPIFAFFAHALSFKEGGAEQVREVALFGMFSILPYLAYVAIVYFAVERIKFEYAILSGLCLWFICAGTLYVVWNKI